MPAALPPSLLVLLTCVLGGAWRWPLLDHPRLLPPLRLLLPPCPPPQFGYYSLLAASMGCRVVAWEPVPHFAAYFKYALLRNNMTRAVEVRPDTRFPAAHA